MVTLKEYLGGLVTSVTNARVMSDVQTVKVAEEYAKHPLLKHFSIPRMRVEDIEMTVPVALDEITEAPAGEFELIDKVKFISATYAEILNNFSLSTLPRTASQRLRGEIAEQTQVLDEKIRATRDLSYLKDFSREIAKTALKIPELRELSRVRVSQDVLQNNLEKALAPEIKIIPPNNILEDLSVIVEAHKLREVKPEAIIYIKLRISEDGLEWDRAEDSEGNVTEKLLPE